MTRGSSARTLTVPGKIKRKFVVVQSGQTITTEWPGATLEKGNQWAR